MTLNYKILCLLLCLGVLLNAQTKDFNKLFKKKLYEADDYFRYDNYYEALPIYEELYSIDSSNFEVNFKLGVCKFEFIKDKRQLLKFFDYSKNKYIDAYFYLGRIYHLKMLFDRAIDAYVYYKNSKEAKSFDNKLVDYYIDRAVYAKKMFMNPTNIKVYKIDGDINTQADEYVPLITSDESVLLFTSRRKGSTGGKLDPNNEFFEDIYISYYKDGKWQSPKNIGRPVNSYTHDACVSLSPDGHKMLIYRTNPALTGGDIYETVNENGNWTTPQKLTPKINLYEWLETSAAYTPDEQTIYFSSNRPGGIGGKDLYRITKMPDGTWSNAQNLGATINTPYDEDAPFIHPDGNTLYFSSKGHNNMGGYDIFMSEKTQDGWTAPQNLGYPVNTVFDDIYFVVSANKEHAYFSSNREKGNLDIYKVDLGNKKSNYIVLRGVVSTNEPKYKKLSAIITVIDSQTKELLGIYRTNEKTGKYILVLMPGKKYKMFVEADGYYSSTDEIDMRDKLRYEDLFKNINLIKVEGTVNDTIR